MTSRRPARRVLRGGLLLAGLVAAGLSFASPRSAGAEPSLHALIVGINDYVYISPLNGPVNDARMIAEAVRPIAASSRVLLNQDATLANFRAAWNETLSAAAPGDTILLTFAGHGTQDIEEIANNESDHKDEVLTFVNYNHTLVMSGMRTDALRDDEVDRMFRDAGERGLRIVFVVDACNSGTMTRSIVPGAASVRTRMTRSYNFEDDMRMGGLGDPAAPAPAADPAAPAIVETPHDHVTYLAAGIDGQAIPEFPIEGEIHGALSWSFARALSGKIETDAGGRVTRGALTTYILSTVRGMAEAKQDPTLMPIDRGNEVLFTLPPRDGADTGVDVPALPFAITGTEEIAARRIAAGLADIDFVDPTLATLTWDQSTGVVISAQADVVVPEVGQDQLQGVIDKFRALRLIRELSGRAAIDVRVTPDNRIHREGDQVGYHVHGLEHANLILFGLQPDGSLQHYFPAEQESGAVDTAAGLDILLEAGPPFGADHIVAIASERPLDGLIAELRARSGTFAGAWLVSSLQGALAGMRYQIDAHPLFTGPR